MLTDEVAAGARAGSGGSDSKRTTDIGSNTRRDGAEPDIGSQTILYGEKKTWLLTV